MKTILWILTTTKDTPKTAEYAFNQARSKDARLVLLLVLDNKLGQQIFRKLEQESFFGGGQSGDLAESLIQDYEERGRRKFTDIETRAVAKSVSLEARLKRGDAAGECVLTVRELQPEEVILTRMHGSRFCRFFFTAAVDKIKATAACLVTVIDEKEES